MTVIKNRSTERGREFWDQVETVARQVRQQAERNTWTYEQVKVSMINPIEMLREICKILGYYAPERKELAGPGGGPIALSHESKPLSLWTDEELDAHYRRTQLQNSVLGVLEGVSEEREPVTIDAKLLTE